MLIIHNFAVFEGLDGSGTTTQLRLLAECFAGHPASDPPLPPFFDTSEPTGGPVGRLIRSVLGGEISLEPATVAGLFAADRHEHLYGKNGIIGRCRQGELVVSDRYLPSSLVYQGITCGEELPRKLNSDFPFPELLLFFDLDPQTAGQRIKARAGRDIYEHLEFQIRARERYKALLPEYEEAGVRVERVDASAGIGDVAGAVWRAVQKMPIMSR
ncbi:MAG: dTMP kinase [Spirochaetaceae bacterium]|jgi:dTMP kinase|nr:dTMP kinase [Spirochaetaceae bacterium]